MTEKTTVQLIQEHLETLPVQIKDAIASFDWAREVFDIGISHNLHVDQVGEIQTEVMLVVLGLLSPRDFFEKVVEIVGDKENAEKVAEDINAGVFVRIRKYLQNGPMKPVDTDAQEKAILHKAGISFGDEVETVTTMTSPQPVAPAAPVAKAASTPKPAPAPMPNVFETKTTKISAEGKPEGFFDPYREPVE